MPLLEVIQGYDVVYKWFDILVKSGNYILGYVLMPNHVHVLIGFKNSGIQLNKIIGSGKRFMSYDIMNRLQILDDKECLSVLANSVSKSERNDGKRYRVWQKSFDWKECKSDKFIIQKLNYIHENPVRQEIVGNPEDYLYSSAVDYSGLKGLVKVELI